MPTITVFPLLSLSLLACQVSARRALCSLSPSPAKSLLCPLSLFPLTYAACRGMRCGDKIRESHSQYLYRRAPSSITWVSWMGSDARTDAHSQGLPSKTLPPDSISLPVEEPPGRHPETQAPFHGAQDLQRASIVCSPAASVAKAGPFKTSLSLSLSLLSLLATAHHHHGLGCR